MGEQNTRFEIANNFNDLKEKLTRSINGSEGYIKKMLNQIQEGSTRNPMGQNFDSQTIKSMHDDGGFYVSYSSAMSGKHSVQVGFNENEISFANEYDPPKGKRKKYHVIIKPTEDGKRCVVEGPAEMFVGREDDSRLDKLFTVGVRNLMRIDGYGDNNLSQDMMKKLFTTQRPLQPQNTR